MATFFIFISKNFNHETHETHEIIFARFSSSKNKTEDDQEVERDSKTKNPAG
jgi:hypothetical protein